MRMEVRNLDTRVPHEGQVVWVLMEWDYIDGRITRGERMVQVVYGSRHGLPLMFHSLDWEKGYPEIREYMVLVNEWTPISDERKRATDALIKNLDISIKVYKEAIEGLPDC